jgi:NAD-dependent SIR2 family protein deacetylase
MLGLALHSNFLNKDNIYTCTWVEGCDFENLSFYVGIVCPKGHADTEYSKFTGLNRMNIDFGFLNVNGELFSAEGAHTIPIQGMTVLWAPDRKGITTDILAEYFRASQPPIAQPAAGSAAIAEAKRYIEITSAHAADLIKGKKVLLFTGAGISMAAGLPDLEGLNAAIEGMFYPLDSYIDDILNNRTGQRVKSFRDYMSLFIESEPTAAHYLVASLCREFGFDLATGNFDNLHQKTGLNPIFQNTDDVVIPNLEQYDYILTIGLNVGIGSVDQVFRAKNPQGRIIAICPEPPYYLTEQDYYVNEPYDDALSSIIKSLKEKSD